MAEITGISWTDSTFNPWSGCSKVSPGCAHCYAETMALRNPKTLGKWGDRGTRVVMSDAYWDRPLQWNRQAEKTGIRRRVFCASMSDVFEDRPELASPLGRLLLLIHQTPHLDWLLLTKRPELFRQRMLAAEAVDDQAGSLAAQWRYNSPMPNIWLGVSVEEQQLADERIPILLDTPASVRFLSIEPLLERVCLRKWLPAGCANWQCQKCKGFQTNFGQCRHCRADSAYLSGSHVANKRRDTTNRFLGWTNKQPLDWVIVGGESGPKCRPMNTEWARSLRDQCRAAGVAFFCKQLGGHPNKRDALNDLPEDLRIREFPTTERTSQP